MCLQTSVTVIFPRGFSPYAASNEAIRGLSRVASHEWAGITSG